MVGKSLALPNRMRHFPTTIMLVLPTSLSVVVAGPSGSISTGSMQSDFRRTRGGRRGASLSLRCGRSGGAPSKAESESRTLHADTARERPGGWWFYVRRCRRGNHGEAQTVLLVYLTGSFVAGGAVRASFGVGTTWWAGSQPRSSAPSYLFSGVVWISGSV
jgi:hypothetical protein